MSNDLSKQLCELCGIERKWIKYTTETTDGCVNYGSRLVYPDFTKPENFVRLFNLETKRKKKSTVAEWVTFENLSIKNVREFLEELIEIIESDIFVDKLKQSIREGEWIYE